MFAELFLASAVTLLAFAFYKWAISNNTYFEKRGVKYLKPAFFIGNSGPMFSSKYTAAEYAQTLYNAFPNESLVFLQVSESLLKRLGI